MIRRYDVFAHQLRRRRFDDKFIVASAAMTIRRRYDDDTTCDCGISGAVVEATHAPHDDDDEFICGTGQRRPAEASLRHIMHYFMNIGS